jgi:lipopolysaccharide transport system ATP-binding protein
MNTVIQVENLGKKYVIGHQKRERYLTLRDTIMHELRSIGYRLQHPLLSNRESVDIEEFWALKDVGFEVKKGDRVGIIGRNGAGKTTLLKILSRVTEPTIGRIKIKGQVASLLEVGTGFHPELTGRENIYLNGAILGMSKVEIKKKFDEIVAFAEIEKFLDTPVKRYSSGMYVRLAFAVAAHLEPEILLVDEVLAVGDAQFQKKCLGKMEEVGQEGRTVLFVSHNMAAIEQLCQNCILLDKGRIRYNGSKTEAITTYLTSLSDRSVSLHNKSRIGSGEIKVIAIQIRDEKGNILNAVKSGQNVDIYFYFEKNSDDQIKDVLIGFLVRTAMESPVFIQHNRLTQDDFGLIPKQGAFVCRINRLPLVPSVYKITYSIMPNNGIDGTYFDQIRDAIELTVLEGDFYNSGEVPRSKHGVCLVDANWHIEV